MMLYVLVVLVLSVPNQNGPALQTNLSFMNLGECDVAAANMVKALDNMGASAKAQCVPFDARTKWGAVHS
jgi:hypothetical protein